MPPASGTSNDLPHVCLVQRGLDPPEQPQRVLLVAGLPSGYRRGREVHRTEAEVGDRPNNIQDHADPNLRVSHQPAAADEATRGPQPRPPEHRRPGRAPAPPAPAPRRPAPPRPPLPRRGRRGQAQPRTAALRALPPRVSTA